MYIHTHTYVYINIHTYIDNICVLLPDASCPICVHT